MTHGVDDAMAVSRLDILEQVSLSRYFVGISLTLSLYDWILLLGQESQTAWKTRWSWSKLIYFNNRVANLVGLIVVAVATSDLWKQSLPRQFCMFYAWFSLPLEWISFLLGNIILTLRVIALYNRNLLVIRLLYILLALCWTSSFGFTIHTLVRVSSDIDYSRGFHACVTDASLSLASGVFIGPAIFECTIFALTLYRAISYARQKALMSNFRTPFLATLYRDGFYYFAGVFAVHLWNVIAYLTQPVKGNYMGTHFAWTVVTIMSSRIYLNLVWAAYGVEAEEEEDGEDERRRVVSMTTGIYPESTSNRWTRPAVHTDALTFSIHPSDERRERQHAFPMAITDYAWKHEANSTSKV